MKARRAKSSPAICLTLFLCAFATSIYAQPPLSGFDEPVIENPNYPNGIEDNTHFSPLGGTSWRVWRCQEFANRNLGW